MLELALSVGLSIFFALLAFRAIDDIKETEIGTKVSDFLGDIVAFVYEKIYYISVFIIVWSIIGYWRN